MNQPAQHRVLLVDDDDAILEVISTAFSHEGYIVLEARDGSEALVRAERDAPDLVVLDLVMPAAVVLPCSIESGNDTRLTR